MKIFLTGGTGFIGTYVVRELLRRGNKLLLLSRDPAKDKKIFSNSKNLFFVKGDLSHPDRWKHGVVKFKPDAAAHMAWEGIPDYGWRMSFKNLSYGLNLLALLGEAKCKKIIITGSCWEYNPPNAFAVAKNALHDLGDCIAKEYGMTFLWPRLFFVYGPGQKKAALIPFLLNEAKQGRMPELKNPDGGEDFIFVEDVARALASLLKLNATGTYDIGCGKITKVRDIAKETARKFRLPLQVKVAKKNDYHNKRIADISNIRKNTGWRARVTIQEGIKKMMHNQ